MEFYHTYNRGVEKRKIFLEETDFIRGIHDAYEFNDVKAVVNLGQKLIGSLASVVFDGSKDKRDGLVNMISWCLMPNHYHFFLYPVKENGLSKFHQKFGGGFTNFFNIKYSRSGVLFQGGYKKVKVTNDAQALQLICYIHSNPLDLWKPNWKEKGLTDLEIQNALKFLEEYRWSSHLDWWGIKNFPSIIDTNSSNRFFKNFKEYKEFFTNWLRYYGKNINIIQGIILDK